MSRNNKGYLSTKAHRERDRKYGSWSHGRDDTYEALFEKHAPEMVLIVTKTDYGHGVSLRVVEIVTIGVLPYEAQDRLKRLFVCNYGLRDGEEIRFRPYDKQEEWIFRDLIKQKTEA